MSVEKRKTSNENSKIIVGIDILPGKSPSSASQPHYAMVVLKGVDIIAEYEDVSLSRFIRLAWEYKPSIIAIDNIYELASSESKLMKIVSLLPPETELVQVTGWGPQAVNIKSLARSLGIEVSGKLTPLKTAYLAALIASKGYGYKVKLLEEKTKIIVSRGRRISHGGMSYNRFVRSVRAGILSVTKEIKRILDKNRLDYDLVFRKAKGGLERSIFIVYAPRSKLYGLIKPINTKSVRVEIRPVYKHKILVPRSQDQTRNKPIIVGLDPGVSTGIAIIDLNGAPLFTYSSKNIDRSDIINIVSSIGVPVIIATDTNPPPDAVKKLAASLKAQLYIPPRSLSSDEKMEIISMLKKKYPWLDIDDTHERDALAAAYKAYQSLEAKFVQAEENIEKMGIGVDLDNIKVAIIRGKTIAEAIEAELEKIFRESLEPISVIMEKSAKKTIDKTCEEEYKRIEKLSEKIRILEAEKIRLQNEIRRMREKIRELEVELNSVKHSYSSNENLLREIERLRTENKVLSQQLIELKEKLDKANEDNIRLKETFLKIVFGKYIPIPVVKNASRYTLNKLLDAGSEVRALYVENTKTITEEFIAMLKKEKIALLVKDDSGLGSLSKHIPVLNINKFRYYLIDDYLFIEPRIIDIIKRSWRVIEEQKKKDEFEKVIKLIEEYQKERKKKLGVKDIKSFEF